MEGRIDSATHWWSMALQDYVVKQGSLPVSDTTSPKPPSINQQQIEAFRNSLQQQLREASQTDTGWSRPIVLFVNSERACPELTTAAEAAGIPDVHRILPEDTVMRIYSDEVMVTRGYRTGVCNSETVWPTHL